MESSPEFMWRQTADAPTVRMNVHLRKQPAIFSSMQECKVIGMEHFTSVKGLNEGVLFVTLLEWSRLQNILTYSCT